MGILTASLSSSKVTSFDKRPTRPPHLFTPHSQSSQCPDPTIPTLATISSHSTLSKATAVAAATLLNKTTTKVATASNSNTPNRATHSILLKIKASDLLIVKTPSVHLSRAVSNTAKLVANTVPMMLATHKVIQATTDSRNKATAAMTPTLKTKHTSNN